MPEETKAGEPVAPVIQDELVVTPEFEITNAMLKKHPHVQDAFKAKAELAAMKKAQADSEATAEREKLESESKYEEALELEKRRVKQLETEYANKTRALEMQTEFAKAGIGDLRAIRVFEGDYNPDAGTIAEFVASIKQDEQNKNYFADPNQRVVYGAPPTSGSTSESMTPQAWEQMRKSNDPDVRVKAALYAQAYMEAHEGCLPQ